MVFMLGKLNFSKEVQFIFNNKAHEKLRDYIKKHSQNESEDSKDSKKNETIIKNNSGIVKSRFKTKFGTIFMKTNLDNAERETDISFKYEDIDELLFEINGLTANTTVANDFDSNDLIRYCWRHQVNDCDLKYKDDIELNEKESKNIYGRVLSRFETDKGPIYVITYMQDLNTHICYTHEY